MAQAEALQVLLVYEFGPALPGQLDALVVGRVQGLQVLANRPATSKTSLACSSPNPMPTRLSALRSDDCGEGLPILQDPDILFVGTVCELLCLDKRIEAQRLHGATPAPAIRRSGHSR